MKNLNEQHHMSITGIGEETRDFTYIGDIVNGLISMAMRDGAIGEAINLGAGMERLQRAAGLGQKNRLPSCIDKASNILRYTPQTEFQKGLEMTYQWFAENWENIKKSAEF